MDVINYYSYQNRFRQPMYPYNFNPKKTEYPGFVKYAEREMTYIPEPFRNYQVPQYWYNYNRVPPVVLSKNMNIWKPPEIMNIYRTPSMIRQQQILPNPLWSGHNSDTYPVPSSSFNGFYGRSQIISLGLKNLTKEDVSFSNTDLNEKNNESDNLQCSVMQMFTGPFQHLEPETHTVHIPKDDPLKNVSPTKALWQTVPINNSINIEDSKQITPEPEYAIQVDEIESSFCFSTQDQIESPFESVLTTITFTSSTEMGTALSDEYYTAIQKPGDSTLSAEAFAQGDREKHRKIHSKYIDEVTLNILKMFAHHEGEDFFDKWTPEDISQLGPDTGINMRYLMHILNESDELNRALTKRQKRDLAGMIDAQVARFKLVGKPWATTCEEIILGISSRSTLFDKLLPYFMKEVDY